MVVDEQWRIFTCDTVTGDVVGDIPATGPSWNIRQNGGGISVTIPTRSREVGKLDIRTGTALIRRSLGVAYGQHVMMCGPIWSRDYDGAGKMKLEAEGLKTIFDHRKAIQPEFLHESKAHQVTTSTLSLGPLSLGSIARELVRGSLERNPYGFGGLNVVLPPLQAGTETRIYRGYDMRWIGEILDDLTAEAGGPDIRFRPRYQGGSTSRVEWVMETGDPYLKQTGEDWRWDGSRPHSGVVGFSTHEDGRGVAQRAWRPGQGQEAAMLLGQATKPQLAADGYPWLEMDTASKQEDNLGTLNGLAARDLGDASGPKIQFGITVRADKAPTLGSYNVGDYAVVVIPEDHPTLDPGPQKVRIMGIDGDSSRNVKLTIAPFTGVFGGSPVGAGKTIAAPLVALYPDPNLHPGRDIYPS